MKLVRLATVAALSTTILVGGVHAFAEEARNVTTEGETTFRAYDPEEDEGEEVEVIPPETDPEVEIDPEEPGVTGPLSIVKAATMNFGTQVISNRDQTYDMVAEMANLSNGNGQVPYVSFAQVQDIRGTNDGWDLQVSLSDFQSSTPNNRLIGAELHFVNSRIQYEGNSENAPSKHTDGLALFPNGEARSVMTASEGKGAGVSSVVWGDQADLNAQFADDEVDIVKNSAIQLSIPGSTVKDATTYTSTLTWELTTTPDEDGPSETIPEEEV
ncbi:WxL domain-containing protein [Enterococcus sp. OL5]|uniref:WxL domain-containing protein n=1 Tax=Enterococcus sp. OL5 TaxID=2590214 RepID=UPI00112A6F77|nr:WxL domain-containing protein [Enterococcus sp. OL5]TPR56919.1 WxL domain-containing protein [Enterococcus sp. OL5]